MTNAWQHLKCGEIWDMGEVLNTNLMTEKVYQNFKKRPKNLKIANNNLKRALINFKIRFFKT